MARIRKRDDATTIGVAARDFQRDFSGDAGRRIGEQELVVKLSKYENVLDKGLDEIPLGDTLAIAGLDHTVGAQIINESATRLRIVVAEGLAATGPIEIDAPRSSKISEPLALSNTIGGARA